jgi:hypothetical protein
MRPLKKTCFRHTTTQVFLATVLCVFLFSVYALYAAVATKKPVSAEQSNILTAQSSVSKERIQNMRQLSLEKERANQFVRDDQATHHVPFAPAVSIYSDRFTQSEAHMSLPEIKKLIAKNYDLKPYDKFIAAILSNEKKYKDGYYVFYHGTDNVWRLPQDLYTQLYAYFNPLGYRATKDFTFLRFEDEYGPSSAQEFLVAELKKSGLINDHGKMGAILLSANLALFGNVGVPSECTWEYFMKSRGHANPSRITYEKIMDKFGLTHKYIEQLMSLVKLYDTKEQTIVQIFVPKDKVDQIGYLSWIKGIPAHKETMDWVKRSVKNKTYPKTQPAIVDLTETFKHEQEVNPIFKNLMERVEAGDFSLDDFLHMYRNNPEKIVDINDVMARLIFTPDVLLNPDSGVKFFRFSTATPERLQVYHQRLNEIVDKIIAEKNAF